MSIQNPALLSLMLMAALMIKISYTSLKSSNIISKPYLILQVYEEYGTNVLVVIQAAIVAGCGLQKQALRATAKHKWDVGTRECAL